MSVPVYIAMLLTISGRLELALADKWVKSNPQGSFAMGFSDGYINNGDYEVVVPRGSDETSRDVYIKSKDVRDSVDMIFNPNTMVFSNWDGYFKLGDKVYSDAPGILYFMRSDHKCNKKKYEKQGDEIRAIDREVIDESRCQAIKAKVDEKMNHFLKYPFKYMLPKPDLELASKRGFPGGEYYTGKVTGNVYVCQFTVNIPSGDSDQKKEIEISAPGIFDKVTMRVDSNTQMYGKWDGSFYIGDKVYTNEPRVLYVDNDKGGCVKKVYEDHDTSIGIAFTRILQANECFLIKNEVYNNMQYLIADPKLLTADEHSKLPSQSSPPITVTSTISGSSGAPLQSTHTVTLNPSASSSTTPGLNNAKVDVSGLTTGSVQTRAPVTHQTPVVISNLQQPQTSSPSAMNSNVHISTITSDHPDYPSVTATSVVQSSNQPQQYASVSQPQEVVINQGLIPQQVTVSNLQQPLTSSASGMNSNVHISTITSDHPDYPSVTATSVVQSSNQPQQYASVSQPPEVVINQGQLARLIPQEVTVSQLNNGVSSQQLVLGPSGDVQLVVPPASSPPQNAVIVQPTITLQSNTVPQTDQNNALNVHSNNVNIQPDGSLLVDGKSVILQGIDPNSQLVTPDGNVIRVGRSINQGNQQMGNSVTVQTATLANQIDSPPVITLTGTRQTPSGSVQTILAVPPNQASSEIQHTTTVNIPGNELPQGPIILQTQPQNQSPLAVNTNIVVKDESTQQPTSKLYFLQNKAISNNEVSELKTVQKSPLLLKLIQPGTSSPTVLRLQSQNTQLSPQNIQSLNIQNLNENQSTQRTNIMVSTQAQPNTIIPMNTDKPVVLTVQRPSVAQGSQVSSNVHVNVGNTGSSILLKPQEGNLQSNIYSQSVNGNNIEIGKNKKDSSVFNLMKDLNLPNPVNNLIVNIAENTNFQKKKK